MNNGGALKIKGMYVLIAILVIILVLISSTAGYIIDYQWFSELDFKEVFFKKLFTQIQFFVPSLLVLFVVFYLYIKSINAHSIKHSGVVLNKKEKRKRNGIFALISFVISFLFSLVFVSEIWYEFLIFINKGAFGIADPIFSRDIGFYMFSLPFLNKLYGFLMGLIVILGLITLLYNGFTFATTKTSDGDESVNVRTIYNQNDIYKSILGAASKQLIFLGGIFFILLGFGFYLRIFDILYSDRGVAYGASYTDIHVTLPSYYVYIAICAITAILMIVSWSKKKLKLAAFGPLLLVVAMVASGLIATGIQNVIVSPNEIVKEEPYLQNNIKYTNYAYGLDKVVVKPFGVEQNLVLEDIEENIVTINNIPINDYRPALDIYNQIQGLKNYYQFRDMDIDRYVIDGVYRQVFVSPREILSSNIPGQTGGQTASWINKYLKYTHGYGVAMSPVNEVTTSGRPRFFIKDMPVVSDINISIDTPQIYFGELTNDFVIVNTNEKEFDHPASDKSVESTYAGTGGIKLNLFNRMLFAIKEGKMNFLLSQDITSESKALIYRDVKERAQKVAPFLVFDDDPYVVVEDGKIFWIIDAYTTSNKYPYSEPINEYTTTNYLRNSVKVVIDAYNGTTDFYIADSSDPIVNTYSSIFKTLFKNLEDMPESLRAHIRYPQLMFDTQASIYKRYHMLNAREFYNKNDVWDIATQIYDLTGQQTERQEVESTYLIMRLPESDKEEFLLMVPYTPQGKTNMISWLGVKNDGDNYGQLILYSFPSGKIVEGPMQIEGIISQDTIIGPQLNLLTTGGNSQVTRGNMLIVPINDSILYVEPIYVKAVNANALPELKKVIVFYKNRVIMENTLEDALAEIFSNGKKPTDDKEPVVIDIEDSTIEELINSANNIYNESQEALKAGNWTDYGIKLEELEQTLNKLNYLVNPTTEQIEQNTEDEQSNE